MRRLFLLIVMLLAAAGTRGSVLFDQMKQEFQAKGAVDLQAGDEPFPVALGSGLVAGKNVPRSDIDIYLYLLRKELGKYPAEIFALAGLKRVVLGRELSVGGQPRAAVTDVETGTIYLDVRSGIYSETYRRKVVHHDFFRLIEAASRDGTGDAEWVALNAPGTLYGKAGAAVPGDNKGALVTHPVQGFINTNAMASVEDDKAEVFAHLMVNDLKVRLLLKDDAVLRAKVQRLKESLARFCPQADEVFWARVAKQF